jgi:halimadienyl-diphosphate synthase
MDYIEEARELVRNLDQRMGPSAYDIAWMARVKDLDGNPRWPELIEWLLENQHPDGSWGGEIEYYHDRIICTLVAIIALHEDSHFEGTSKALQKGEQYLWRNLHLLPRDPFELVGFELIVPTLLGEAQRINLDVPNHACGYGAIQTKKLNLVPPNKLYSPKLSTVFSLEFMGSSGDIDKLSAALNENGSIGNSPATTAYYLVLNPEDMRARNYLERIINVKSYGIPVYPFRVFELTWVLNNLLFTNISVTGFAGIDIWEELQSSLGPKGVGSDTTFIPDGDCTSVCCHVLLQSGHEVAPLILGYYEDKKRKLFRTYPYERNISISTNIHALDALRSMPNYPQQEELRESIVLMLLNNREYNIYWTDKWHASPYYATSHALVALLKENKEYLIHACRHTIDWLIHNQRLNGSWGFFDRGTPEETAYVLTALLHYDQQKSINPDILHQAADYLAESYEEDCPPPPLWIIKSLFLPYNIVRSAVLSSLILYEKTFKNK